MDRDRSIDKSQPFYYRASEFTDTILVIENVEILVNRKFLASRSSYFEHLLLGSFKESKETRVELKEVKLSVFYECLCLMHGIIIGGEPGSMDLNHLSELIKYARLFDLPVVLKYIEWELGFPSKGCEVERYLLACQYSLHEDIKKALLKFINKDAWTTWLKNKNNKEEMTELKKADLVHLLALNHVDGVEEDKDNAEEKSLSGLMEDVVLANQRDESGSEVAGGDQIKTGERVYSYYDADVQLEVEGTTIGVNRNNLSCMSPFFYKLFNKNKEYVVQLEKVKLDVLIECLDIMHDQYIKGVMPIRRLYHLLDLSYFLQLLPVFSFCFMELYSHKNIKSSSPVQPALVLAQFCANEKIRIRMTDPSLDWKTFDYRRFYVESMKTQIVNIDIHAVSALLVELSGGLQSYSSNARGSTKAHNELDWQGFSTKSLGMDTSILVEDTTFYVNKWVLGCHSPYFKEMLLEKGNEELVLEDVDPEVFLICLNIIHGHIPETLVKFRSSYVVEMMKCAYQFKMPLVKTFCELGTATNSEQDITMFFHSLRCDTENIQHYLSRLNKTKITAWIRRHLMDDSDGVLCRLPIPTDVWLQLIDIVKANQSG